MRKIQSISLAFLLIPPLSACEKEIEKSEPTFTGIESFVSKNKIGKSEDFWIEMKNLDGDWEKVGLIFGYYGDDLGECKKAITGLKDVNHNREYRCKQANF